MGIDIEKGEPGSSSALYSIAVVDSRGRLVNKVSGTGLARFIRMVWEYRPGAIGVDNIYELGRDDASVVRILSMLPPETDVIQVNIIDGSIYSVREAARRAGISLEESKPSPLRTAYIAAVLAMLGMGTKVKALEERTLITIARARSPGSGGWSQQRFQRRLRASINAVANQIRSVLEEASLDYDYQYRASDGGLESARFIVYAPYSEVSRLLKKPSSPDVRVRVRPIYRDKLLFLGKEESSGEKPVIVGIDPGVSTGIAIISVDGSLLYADSFKGIDRGRIVELVKKYGKPVVIAVDVASPPEMARKLASYFGAQLYAPPENLASSEKRELASRLLGGSVKDTHVRDAVAAAVKAFQGMKSKLAKVESYIEDMDIELDVERVKREVVMGKTIADAIEAALKEKLESLGDPGGSRVQRRESRKDDSYQGQEYASRLHVLEAEKLVLENRVRELERRLLESERALRRIVSQVRVEAVRDAEVRRLRDRVETLEGEIESLRRKVEGLTSEITELEGILLRVARGELVMARVLDSMMEWSLSKSEKLLGPLSQGEVIYVADDSNFSKSVISKLSRIGVKGVLVKNPGSPLSRALEREGIPVEALDRYEVVDRGKGYLLVSSRVVEALEQRREELKKRGSSIDLKRIVEEYRSSKYKRRF